MNKRTSLEYQGRNELRHHNWDVTQTDNIAFNSGYESNDHWIAKAQVGFYLKRNGWRVDSEVEHKERGDVADIVAYGRDDPPFVVEVETEITEEIREKKLKQFYRGEPFSEVFILEVSDLPADRATQLDWLDRQLPGDRP